MQSDLSAWFGEVSKALDSQVSLRDGMQALLAYCNEQHPWRGWGKIGGLDFEADVARLGTWLNGVLKKEPPPDSVIAYWFGIYNPVYDRQASCDAYIAGTKKFDPGDESFQWACNPVYFPAGKYAHSKVLDQIYRAVNKSPVSAMGEYTLCLGYTAFAVRELVRRTDKDLLLGKSDQRGLAVGFDSGDGVVLEAVSR
ncbi:MAG: hypothetical protein U0996_24765 [Planctomycetaceae bacterium]